MRKICTRNLFMSNGLIFYLNGFRKVVCARAGRVAGVLLTLLSVGLPCGCESMHKGAEQVADALQFWQPGELERLSPPAACTSNPVMAVQIMPGDDIEINVFGAPDLNTLQKVRMDGKISAKLFGDIQAAGRQPAELQKELTTLYESQVQIKAVTVIVRSAAVIYVTGAVVRQGAIPCVRPMTALDAIMECGGFDARAGARRGQVHVIRNESNQVCNITVDLESILTESRKTVPLYLRPFDTVYVPGAW